jgi:hypothetical protein
VKKKKFVSKYARIDALNYVLSGLKRVGSLPTAGVELKLKNHEAFDELLKGEATTDHVDVLIAAANMAEAMTKVRPSLGIDCLPEIRDAQNAIKTMASRGLAKKRFLFTGPEMQVMKLFMTIHDAQIDECTVQEMEVALKIVAQVIRNGTAEKIVEMA